ncbi:MAG: hypothetical protein WB676_18515 [Bryobacteraceae bacterium]
MSQEYKPAPHSGHGPTARPPSEPHVGHGGTTFEGVDARPGLIIGSLATIALMLIVVFALTVGVQKYLTDRNPQGELPSAVAPSRVVPPTPQLQPHPWEELPDLRAHEDQILNSFGKDAEGHVHIPIDRAMDAVVARLPIRPGSPEGIDTPGGEGRDFAKSLSEMPAPYRRAPIQGEIHKHAQK